MVIKAFKPFVNSDSETLILGSFPSVKSRQENFFYGNNQNRFWKIISEILGDVLPQNIEEKKAFLIKHKIALWDIVSECEIEGSLDANIKNPHICDLTQVFKVAAIKKIIINGATAKKFFKKAYPLLDKITFYLPSTSPANVKFDFKAWEKAIKADFIIANDF